MVTGQYYLSEINSKLSSIERKTDKILKHLENQKKSELWADNQVLDTILGSVDYIMTESVEKTANVQMVKEIKRGALQKIKFYDLSITECRESISMKSKSDELISITDDMAHKYLEYWFAIYLFAKATVCEILLGGIVDPNVISRMKEEIIEYCEMYKTAYAQDEKEIREIIDKAKALNQKFKLPAVRSRGRIKEPVLAMLVATYEAAAVATNVSADKKKGYKDKVRESYDEMLKGFNDTPILDSIVDGIDDYKERVTCPMEILQYNGEVYVKFVAD